MEVKQFWKRNKSNTAFAIPEYLMTTSPTYQPLLLGLCSFTRDLKYISYIKKIIMHNSEDYE